MSKTTATFVLTHPLCSDFRHEQCGAYVVELYVDGRTEEFWGESTTDALGAAAKRLKGLRRAG